MNTKKIPLDRKTNDENVQTVIIISGRLGDMEGKSSRNDGW